MLESQKLKKKKEKFKKRESQPMRSMARMLENQTLKKMIKSQEARKSKVEKVYGSKAQSFKKDKSVARSIRVGLYLLFLCSDSVRWPSEGDQAIIAFFYNLTLDT